MKQELNKTQLIKNGSFRYFLYSSIAATFAGGLNYIILIWIILQVNPTVNATLIGMLLFWTPTFFLSPYFGGLIDYSDRKKLAITTGLVRSIKFIFFAIIIWNHPTLWEVYGLAFLSGCFGALYKPLYPALILDLVGEDNLITASTISRVTNQVGNIIGRGLFTVVIFSLVKTYEAIFIVAALYLASGLLLLPTRFNHIKHDYTNNSVNVFTLVIKGYRYLASQERLILKALTQGVIFLFIISSSVLIGPYVRNILLQSNHFFGLSEGILALGTLTGLIFWSHLIKRLTLLSCLIMSCSVALLAYLILANTNNNILALLSFASVGFSWASYNLIVTEVQRKTAPDYQGRVQSAIYFDTAATLLLMTLLLHFSHNQITSQDAFLWLCFASCILLIALIFTKLKSRKT